jgi:DUF2917 family protein
MGCSGYTKVWDLAKDELVRLDGARGTTLRITRGAVWLTMEHDTRDIILSAGDSFTIDRDGLTLMQAQGVAAVCALGAAEAVRVRPPRPTFVQRARQWLRSVGAADRQRRYAPYY